MIPAEKIPAALYAIHRVLVQARWLVGEKADAAKVYEVLDHAEILPLMLGNSLDDGVAFLGMLESLGDKYPEFSGIAKDYADDVCGQGIIPETLTWNCVGATRASQNSVSVNA